MKRIILAIALFISTTTISQAQFLPSVPDMKGKFITGGNFGFGMSGQMLRASIAPQLGYRITNAIEIGIRGTYTLEYEWNRVYGNYSYHFIGGAPYVSLAIYRGLFIHGEYEYLYYASRNHNQSIQVDRWCHSPFIGGGYRTYQSANQYAYILLLYNLNWDSQVIGNGFSPYAAPIQIRVGYCFGL